MSDDLTQLQSRLVPDNAAVFLDFDGTLIDLAPTPDGIVVPDDLIARLNQLRGGLGGRLAVITGRADADVAQYLSGFEGPIYGSHGGMLHWGQGQIAIGPDPQKINAELATILPQAKGFTGQNAGLVFEEKSSGFALHYRQNPDLELAVHAYLDSLLRDTEALEVQQAKMAAEVKAVGVNKGAALRDAMQRFGWQSVTPWMFGDDTTDEAAFEAATAFGGQGVKIGQGETVAQYRLTDPAELHVLLTYLGNAQ